MTDRLPTQHARAAELAALTVDFTLSAAERSELDRHLAVCGSCNDLLAAYRADAEALRAEAFAHAPERVRAAVGAALTRPASPRAGFRMDVLLAAALLAALLIGGLIVAGAFQPKKLLVDAPIPTATSLETSPLVTPGATAGAAESPRPSEPAPTQSAGVAPVQLPIGIKGVTVTDRLFIRSKAGVDADSAKIEVLNTGTTFRVLDGPIPASDYWWYRVGDISVPLNGGAKDGWLASADHDGTPWIGPAADACVGYTFPDNPVTADSLAALQTGILGTWAGCVTTPWTLPYWVVITFRSDGTYSGTASVGPDGYAGPAFYWGTDADSALKEYELTHFEPSLGRMGEMNIVFKNAEEDLVVYRVDLRDVRVMGDRLDFVVFNIGTSGPLTYRLYRIEPPA